MARRLFYVSLGILALAIAYTLGANSAGAQGRSGAILMMDHNGWVIDSAEQVWNIGANIPGVWDREPVYDPPVPLSEVQLWSAHALVTSDGHGWYNNGGGWVDCGPHPGGPVPVEGSSVGAIKAAYR
jgi:hypothetical protein